MIYVVSVVSTMIQIFFKSHQQLFLKTNRSHPKKIMFEDDFSHNSQGWDMGTSHEGSFRAPVLDFHWGNSRRVGADPGEVDVVMLRPPGAPGYCEKLEKSLGNR